MSDIKYLSDKCFAIEKELAAAKMQIETLEYSCNEKNREIERLHDLIDHLKTGNEKLSSETFGLGKELSAAKAALEAEELKRMDWDVAFEGLEKQLAAAKAEIKPSHCEWNCELCKEKSYLALRTENKRLRAALAAMVAQHCSQESGDYNSGCISANAKALRLLSELGIMEMVHDGIGRQCTAKFARAALDGGNHDNKRD